MTDATARTIERPDWADLLKDTAHTPDRDGELIAVTRETLRLALAAINKQNAEDYYHNFGAAGREIRDALAAVPQDEGGRLTEDEIAQICFDVSFPNTTSKPSRQSDYYRMARAIIDRLAGTKP